MGSASRTKVAAAALALLVPAGALLWHMTAAAAFDAFMDANAAEVGDASCAG
jgi:hypothetical protein